MSFQTIFTDGALVDIDIHTWTGERQLQPEDLGLTEKEISKAFHLGRKTLIPEEIIAKFRHIDYEARRLLTDKGFSFPFGGARFIPKRAMLEFADSMEKIIQKFNEIVADLVTRYEPYKLQMRGHYLYAAHEAYAKVKLLNGFDKTEDEFINEFLARVDTFYPKVEDIAQRFNMTYQVFQVDLPDLSSISYGDIATETEKMKILEESYKKSIYRKINGFVDTLVTELRAKAEVVIKRVREIIKEEGMFNERTLDMIRNMINNYDSLNIVGDSVLMDQLKVFKNTYLGLPSTAYRTSKELKEKMLGDLEKLLAIVTDQAAITFLIANYKNKIQV